MATDPKLVVALEARLNKFEKTLKEAGTIAERQVKTIEDKFDKMNPGMSGLRRAVLAIGSAIIGAGLISKFKGMVDELSKVNDLAQRAQVSTDFIQALGFAVSQAGGSMEDAARAAQRFGKELGEVGTQDNYLTRLLKENGVDVKRIAGDSAAAFDAYSKIVGRAKTPTEALNMVTNVFGDKVGPKMLSTLQQVAGVGLPAFIEQMREAGHVLDESIIKKGDQIGDSWDALVNRMGNKFKSLIIDTVNEWDFLINTISRKQPMVGVNTDRPSITVSKPSKNVSTGAPARDAFQQDILNMQKRLAIGEAELKMIDATTAARERAKVVAELEAEAIKANTAAGLANTAVTAEQRIKIDAMATAMGNLAARTEEANRPLRTFAREARDMNTGLQTVAVSGLRGFEDALIDIGSQTKSTAQAFKEMTASILKDLARLLIRQQITGPLAQLLGSISFTTPGAATAGPMPAGSSPTVPNSPMSRNSMSGQNITLSTMIDARGSNISEARLHQIMNENNARLRQQIIPIVREGRSRKVLA